MRGCLSFTFDNQLDYARGSRLMSWCRVDGAAPNDPETPRDHRHADRPGRQRLCRPGRCREAARDAGISEDEIAVFMAEAVAKDYNHLLQTAIRWFEIR